MSRGYRSIGEVLSLLTEEHPDLTISKIRFLESQGLIAPQRTPSGYRKFFDADVERLNWVLIQQRDNFLPLKEIKRRLAGGAVAKTAPRGAADGPEAAVVTPSLFASRSRDDTAEGDAEATDEVQHDSGGLTLAQMAQIVGVDVEHIAELRRLGLITADKELAGADGSTEAVFDHHALAVARTAAALADHGMPARIARMFKIAADREAGIYEQMLGSLIARGDAERLQAELAEVIDLAESLRRLLLLQAMRPHLD